MASEEDKKKAFNKERLLGADAPIASLKKKLYSRGENFSNTTKRTPLYEHTGKGTVPTDWEDEKDLGSQFVPKKVRERGRRYIRKFLIFSILFFVVAAGVTGIILYRGANIISSKNVEIAVSGPVSIGGGEVLDLQIEVTNRNPAPLEVADLSVEFPSGTREAGDLSKELIHYRELIGDLGSGDRASKSVQAVLFGADESRQSIKITVEYRVAGSNAIFVKERLYEVEISSDPLAIGVSMPTEVNSEQEMEIVIDLTSNAATVIQNALFEAEYPFGFTFTKAVPEPSAGETTWALGDISPESSRKIRIFGKVEAQDEEERSFRFESGIASERDEYRMGTTFSSVLRSLTVKRPFIELRLALDGTSSGIHVAQSGENIRGDVTWKNNLSVPIIDAVLEVHFEGVALDKTSVAARSAFYRSIDNTIIWDKTGVPDLTSIAPGEGGTVSFNFASTPAPAESTLNRAQIDLTTSMSGKRQGDPDTAGQVTSGQERSSLVASNVDMSQWIVHTVGPFANTGPIPPVAEIETTYTVIWSISNSSNDIENTVVTATLPPYVRWVGQVSPSSAPIRFNPVGGLIRWDPGRIRAGTGYITSPTEVAFQIAVLPSVSHIGSDPTTVNLANLTAFDTFAEIELADDAQPITTRMRTDPTYKSGLETVVAQ